MRYTAHEFVKDVLSVDQLLGDTDAHGGAWIDTLGFDEALCYLHLGTIGGTSPTLACKWREADDDPANPGSALASSAADIAGAAFNQVKNTANLIVTSVLPASGLALTIAAQPSAPALITFTLTSSTITTATATIVGTRPARNLAELTGQAPLTAGSQPLTEVVTLTGYSSGVAVYSTNVFDSITSITLGTLGGSIGSDTITVGMDNSGVKCPQVGRLNLHARKRYIQAYTTKGGSAQTGALGVGAILLGSSKLPVVQVLTNVFNVT